MKNILKNAENAEKLLELTSDTMILLDRNGICVDIAVHNADLWFLKENQLLGRNILQLLPSVTYRQVYPEFKKVLAYQEVSARNYELTIGSETYFFKCIMRPYEDMVLCQYRDITERSQRKRELEKKNHELNEIQKAALIGRWKYNSGRQCFYYTGHSGVMCTAEEQEIPLQDYTMYILPEDREIFGKWLAQNLQGNTENSIDYRILFKKRIFYIRLKTFSHETLPDGTGILEGYIQNITDIQQRRNDITLLTHAINNSTEDIFAAREDGTLVFANRRFREHHNISITDDVSTLNIYRINANAQDENSWQRLIKSLRKGDKRNGFILYHPLPEHPEVLAMEGSAYWVTSDKGEAILWGFSRDITQRIRNEQQIKRFSQILDKTIENLPAGIVVKDIQSGFKYLYRNRESYNRNIPLKEALGKDDFDFYPPELAQEKRKQDVEIARTGIEKHWITEEHDQNGKSIFLDKRKVRIESNDFPPILLSIEWDITEMERMKRELLVAKEKAETSDQLKSAFLANMSHEIRTPLNAIVGFSSLLTATENETERKEFISIIETNNQLLLQLVSNILDLSKIEANTLEFNYQNVDLNQLAKDVENTVRGRLQTGVALQFVPEVPVCYVQTEHNRLSQVLINLLVNAAKFTEKGEIMFGYKIRGEELYFYVKDTGIGISLENQKKIFERFTKVNTFIQGTGLGLSICKNIVTKMKGRIGVESEGEGKGSTFWFTIPYKPKEAQKENNLTLMPLLNERSKEKPIILIAEDNESNYMLFKSILQKDYELVHAWDGEEAVELHQKFHPHVVIMDINMPKMDGYEATREIRKVSKTVPIIAVTAYSFASDKEKIMQNGFNGYMSKPVDIQRLKEKLDYTIHGNFMMM